MAKSRGGRKIADIRAEVAAQRRDQFLEIIRAGGTIAHGMRTVGWNSDNAYRHHRRAYPMWAAEVDVALQAVHRKEDAEVGEHHLGHAAFVERYFPDRDPLQAHQVMIADALADLGPRDILMFLLWPEAGKTATLEDHICRTLAYDPTHRFRYVSEASDLAKRVVGTVKNRMTDDDLYTKYIQRFGKFYEPGQEKQGRPWTTEFIKVQRNPSTERDRNLHASSWTSAVYGSRIDTLILDDLCSQRNVNQSAEIKARIQGTFFNRGIQMRTLIIGTRIGPGDFYERMLDAGLVTKLVELRAADTEGNPTVPSFWDRDMKHNGRACCGGFRECPRDGSKLTPREFMELIRHQSGEDTWWASYMQQPINVSQSTFAEYIERCLDPHRLIGQLESAEPVGA